MDATNEANRYSRELTPTEVALATAQIVDRLTRLTKAEHAVYSLYEGTDSKSDTAWALAESKENAIRAKYDIPDGVYLFGEESGDWCDGSYLVRAFTPFIKHWVRGELGAWEAWEMMWFMEEWNEIDYPWAFMEHIVGYYRGADDRQESFVDVRKAQLEFFDIGTRKRSCGHRGNTFNEALFPFKAARTKDGRLKDMPKPLKDWQEVRRRINLGFTSPGRCIEREDGTLTDWMGSETTKEMQRAILNNSRLPALANQLAAEATA